MDEQVKPYVKIAESLIADPKFKFVAEYPKMFRCTCDSATSTFGAIANCEDVKSHMNTIKNTSTHCYTVLMVFRQLFNVMFMELNRSMSHVLYWQNGKMNHIKKSDIPKIVGEYSAILRKLTTNKELKTILAQPIIWTVLMLRCVVPPINERIYAVPYKDSQIIHNHMYQLPWSKEECDIKVDMSFIEALVSKDFKTAMLAILDKDQHIGVVMVNMPDTVVDFMCKAFDTIVIKPEECRHKRPPFAFKQCHQFYLLNEHNSSKYPDKTIYHESVLTDVRGFNVYKWKMGGITDNATKCDLNAVRMMRITTNQYEHMQNMDNHHYARKHCSNYMSNIITVKFNQWTEPLSDLEQRMLIAWALQN